MKTMVFAILVLITGCADVWGFEEGELRSIASSSSASSDTSDASTTNTASAGSGAGSVTSSSSGSGGGNSGGNGSGGSDPCAGGQCHDPTLIWADNDPNNIKYDIAVDGSNLFWISASTSSAIYKCDLNSCANTKAQIINAYEPVSLSAPGNGSLYWIEQEGIAQCSIGSCSSTASLLISDPTAMSLATDSTHAFWTLGLSSGSIRSCLLNNCQNSATILNMAQLNPKTIDVDSTSLFWSTSNGTIVTCTIADCANATSIHSIVGGIANIGGLAVDDAYVYWTEINQGTVERCSKTDCVNTKQAISSELGKPFAIDVDSQNIYVSTLADSGIYRIAK